MTPSDDPRLRQDALLSCLSATLWAPMVSGRLGMENEKRKAGTGVVREMSDDPKRRADVAAKRAAQLFERQQDRDRRVAEEEKRHNDMVTKTARLREQRLARDAAEAGAAKSGKPKARGLRR